MRKVSLQSADLPAQTASLHHELPQSGKEKPENAPVSIRKINKKLMSSEACTIITLESITPTTDKT